MEGSPPFTSDSPVRKLSKMALNNFWALRRAACSALFLAFLPFLAAQSSGVLSVAPLPKVSGKRNSELWVKIPAVLQNGYHVNSHTPSESYLIPLRLTWEPGALQVVDVLYPKPHMQKYQFSPTPLS